MKKILLSAVCLVAVAAAGFGGYTYYENQQMDPWLKANIAALASIETLDKGEGGGGIIICTGGNTWCAAAMNDTTGQVETFYRP